MECGLRYCLFAGSVNMFTMGRNLYRTQNWGAYVSHTAFLCNFNCWFISSECIVWTINIGGYIGLRPDDYLVLAGWWYAYQIRLFFFFQIQLIMTRLSLFLAMFATVVIAGPYSNSQQEIVTKVKNGYRIY